MVLKMFTRRQLASPPAFGVLFILAVLVLVHYTVNREDPLSQHEDILDAPHHTDVQPKAWNIPTGWRLGNVFDSGSKDATTHADCPVLPVPDNTTTAKSEPAVKQRIFTAKGLETPLKFTKMLKHAPGWTIYENLYMAGGTFFIVTDEMSRWPEVRMMTSTGLKAENTPENIQAREPTARDMSFFTMKDAQNKWGDRVWPVDGVTFFLNDPGQFLSHYYHFVAETWMGLWRMYSSLDSDINVQGETTLEAPSRVIFGHCDPGEWRDYSFFNQYFIHGAFPGIGIETSRDWEGRAQLTSADKAGKQKVWRFERLLLADRSASFRGNFCPGRNQRIAAEAWEATKDDASRWWWEPIRRSILRFSGVDQKVMDLPMMWTKDWKTVSNGDVKLTDKEVQVGMSAAKRMPIVVTYIVRNGKRRGMIKEDHEGLVKALTELCTAKKWELNVVHAEKFSKEEQIQLAAKTTVMLGIHGNGLTHLVWMPLTPLSTVIEIFIPGGFAKDYEWTARSLGMKHFAVWNDTYATHPTEPKVDYPEGFQGDRIPAHGPSIAKLIEDRLEGRLP